MSALIDKLHSGDVRTLARLITLVENRTEGYLQALQELFAKTGKACVVGVTGSPGSGKSTLVDRLAATYRDKGKSVGIVAVDPSSPFTGGAILGDRIRMQTFGTDPGVFIRSMATRGYLGGLAATTADVVSVLDAVGRDPVLVETVGVGQDEIDIVRLADVTIVVLVPGMGDDVQALKAGIMEIGDIFVINKCDRPGVEKMERAVHAMLSLAPGMDGWEPPIVRTIATEGDGVEKLRETIDTCQTFFRNRPSRSGRKKQAIRDRLVALLRERLLEVLVTDAFPGNELDRVVDDIAKRARDPYTVVEDVLARLRKK